VRMEREKGVALITALMILMLISAIVCGMCWMVMTDQRLGGNNQSRELAFYGAEAGMEKMTADMGNTFALYGSITAAQQLFTDTFSALIAYIQHKCFPFAGDLSVSFEVEQQLCRLHHYDHLQESRPQPVEPGSNQPIEKSCVRPGRWRCSTASW